MNDPDLSEVWESRLNLRVETILKINAENV